MSINYLDTNPVVLAYIGDAVYDVYVRKHVVELNPKGKPSEIHNAAIKYVNAYSQARILKGIENMLTFEEKDFARKARNKKSGSIPQNVDPVSYRMSTAFEALIGYAHFTNKERLEEIIEAAFKVIEFKKAETEDL